MSKENLQAHLWLNRIARQAHHLLQTEPDPQNQMKWADSRLSQANLWQSPSRTLAPEDWTEQAIAQNPDLMDQSIPWLKERDLKPEEAETFESLILQLLPTESGQ